MRTQNLMISKYLIILVLISVLVSVMLSLSRLWEKLWQLQEECDDVDMEGLQKVYALFDGEDVSEEEEEEEDVDEDDSD
ncbi:uncharacterized protein LY89DRAFT_679125 [Mollisia scopiformis]|uniref:Transmembrane protein n=1 Tax=Mollisia scopiformis TaxID=149040 RepID=A0A194XU12_MOLSC|nr:uncharacterized protein LY89DRAFT_679125 [Mollisia scopiformis]KUJ23810.1 hypothetical protein LY89DRAFT_679125 [Mollisia scopiformis]